MALESQLEKDNIKLIELSRSKLKVVSKYQQEILEYYISTRTHYIRMLKILLDIAKIFQYLQYYHSGLGILEILKDELIKLRSDQELQVDIDITRLKNIVLNLKVDDTILNFKHFYVENIVFEKDILMQHMNYRKGMILLKTDKLQDAVNAYTAVIVSIYIG